MAKETYYFSHDYNARNDKKISALVREFKSSGYGIYWCTAEMLHEEGGNLELDELTLSAICKDLNEDLEFVKTVLNKCISNYKLFLLSSDNILSANRVKRNLDKRKEISKVRSDAGKAGANAKQMLTNAEQKVAKERKGKEKKDIAEPINEYWFNKIYRSDYGEYKQLFNGRSASPENFLNWKGFIDFISEKDYTDIFTTKFINPKQFGELFDEGFTKEKWDSVLKAILATGVKPEHDLFYRIPQFLDYEPKSNVITGKPKKGEVYL